MERLVRYRNKIKAFIWCIILMGAIYLIIQPKVIPDKWVNANDRHFVRMDGFLYYNKKVFSGWMYSNFTNGSRERQTPYYEGKEEGIMHSWYVNKMPEQERLFVNGKKEGIHRGWWPNGHPKFEYQFKNDEHNGTAKEWFNNNKLYRFFQYDNGHEAGLQRLWWADGTLRANYVVKDGVQYGLIGRKFCKNTNIKNENIKKSDLVSAVPYRLPYAGKKQ